MATYQTVLDTMELLDRELELQTNEADVTLGLVAVNRSRSQLESLIAQQPGLLGDDTGTVTTSSDTESTSFPTRVLRLDALYYIDSDTSRPAWKLEALHRTGEHSDFKADPVFRGSTSASGRPAAYWTDGTSIYWSPLPNDTHTVRWYGFEAAADSSDATDTWPYPDITILPVATFAAKLFQVGLDDDPSAYDGLAQQTLGPVVEAMGNFRRDGARSVGTSGFTVLRG